jgi:hypothetical protein
LATNIVCLAFLEGGKERRVGIAPFSTQAWQLFDLTLSLFSLSPLSLRLGHSDVTLCITCWASLFASTQVLDPPHHMLGCNYMYREHSSPSATPSTITVYHCIDPRTASRPSRRSTPSLNPSASPVDPGNSPYSPQSHSTSPRNFSRNDVSTRPFLHHDLHFCLGRLCFRCGSRSIAHVTD